MNNKWVAGLSALMGVAVGVVTNLLTSEWSWALGGGFAVLVCGLVAVAVRGASGDGGASDEVRIEAASGGEVTGNRTTLGQEARIGLRATRRGTIGRNTTNLARGRAVFRARKGRIEDNETEVR